MNRKSFFMCLALLLVLPLLICATWPNYFRGNTLITGNLRVQGEIFPSLGFLESFGEGANKGFMTLQLDGTAEDGTANVHNLIYVGDGHVFNYVPIVAQTAVIAMSANGLNIGLDQTENDGAELYTGVSGASGHGAIIGTTNAFQTCLTFRIADVSGTDDMHFGIRRAETVNATFDSYLDLASIGFVATDTSFNLETILNNGSTTTTDTTDTLADATSVKVCVLVSSSGVVTYTIDGSAPTTTAAFTFDDGDFVIPFLHYLQSADLTGAFDIEEWEFSLQ